MRVEDSKLSPIYCGLLSTFSSLKRSDWPLSMAFAFEKLIVYQKSVDFADQICLRSENFARRLATICVGPINPQAPARPSVATRRHAKASDANPRSRRGTISQSRNATACVNLQINARVESSSSENQLESFHDMAGLAFSRQRIKGRIGGSGFLKDGQWAEQKHRPVRANAGDAFNVCELGIFTAC